MTNHEVGAAGDAVTAGLVASVIEGRTAARTGRSTDNCRNCSAALAGRFCSNCGQRSHLERSLWHLIEQALNGAFHFDGKVWRTLPRLIFRPGQLTRDYVEGRRARYVSPLAMFLMSIFAAFFIVANSLEHPGAADRGARLAKLDEAIAKLKDEETKAQDKDDADAKAGLEVARKAVDKARRRVERGESAGTFDFLNDMREEKGVHVDTGNAYLDGKIRPAINNPELAIYRVKEAASRFAFLLVPLSVPFVWLLFPFRRRTTLFDHTVFVLYSLSFVALLVTFVVAAMQYFWKDADGLVLALPVHMFAQLKGAYGLSTFSAFWRTCMLLIFALIALCLFVIAVALLGLLG